MNKYGKFKNRTLQGEIMYPVKVSIDYPTEPLSKVTSLFRIIVAIPIMIVLSAVSGATAGGSLTFGPMLTIVFRQKYPKWWYDWNLALTQFSTRVTSYLMLMSDKYPSTDEEQNVKLTLEYPDATKLNRWLALVKWFLAIPHYIVLAFLFIGAIFSTLIALFSILFTGKYPEALFIYNEAVIRWGTNVSAYAFLMLTDQYPPFSLSASK